MFFSFKKIVFKLHCKCQEWDECITPILYIYFDWKQCYPGSWFFLSRIPGQQQQQKRRGQKELVVLPLFVTINFTKFKLILLLIRYRKKFEPTDKELKYYTIIYLKDSYSALKKKMGRDPGSAKNLSRIPDPGIKKHRIPDLGFGSATLHWMKESVGYMYVCGFLVWKKALLHVRGREFIHERFEGEEHSVHQLGFLLLINDTH